MTGEEAITKLKIYRDYLCKMSSVVDVNEVAKPFNMAIEALERKRGEWIDYKCSLCGFEPYDPSGMDTFNFCSNCGADMRGEEE